MHDNMSWTKYVILTIPLKWDWHINLHHVTKVKRQREACIWAQSQRDYTLKLPGAQTPNMSRASAFLPALNIYNCSNTAAVIYNIFKLYNNCKLWFQSFANHVLNWRYYYSACSLGHECSVKILEVIRILMNLLHTLFMAKL